jgi:hypothetical protein
VSSFLFSFLVLCVACVVFARAEPPVPSPLPERAKEISQKKSTKGKKIREKEAEGSQAPNRFEADTIIKSQYRLDGEPLEVDPD